jgi:hypothetical protein
MNRIAYATVQASPQNFLSSIKTIGSPRLDHQLVGIPLRRNMRPYIDHNCLNLARWLISAGSYRNSRH